MDPSRALHIFQPDILKDEKDFQVNLLRLAGETSSVTVEHMLQTLIYITNQNVEEALVIEQSYLGNLFNNEEFNGVCCPVSSLDHVVACFQLAKRDDNVELLRQFDAAHRVARRFLDDPEIKKLSQQLASRRKNDMYFKVCWKTFETMLDLVQMFPRGNFTLHLVKHLSALMTALPKVEDSDMTDPRIEFN